MHPANQFENLTANESEKLVDSLSVWKWKLTNSDWSGNRPSPAHARPENKDTVSNHLYVRRSELLDRHR